MAIIELGNTKTANKLIDYCKRKAVEKDGVNCDVDLAKSQFKATREMWGKNDRIQSHHVIQSFKPDEITPEKANQLGKELAEKIGKGHEVAIYTHADTDHIHNHIIINSVNPETGYKYQSTKKDLHNIREQSDRLCIEHNLSVVKEHDAKLRYTFAEKGLLEKGKTSWKDEIREVIDKEKYLAVSMDDFKKNLKERYDIDVKLRGKNVSFKHPEAQRFVRGKKLGMDYEKEELENVFKEQAQDRGQGGGRGLEGEQGEGLNRNTGGNQEPKRPNEELYKGSDGLRDYKESESGRGTKKDRRSEQEPSREDDFNVNRARKDVDDLQRDLGDGYRRKKERDDTDNQRDNRKDGQHRKRSKGKSKGSKRENNQELTRDRERGE